MLARSSYRSNLREHNTTIMVEPGLLLPLIGLQPKVTLNEYPDIN